MGSEDPSVPLEEPYFGIEDLDTIFSDVDPIPQQEASSYPVAQIDYSPAFVIAYDYMRAIWKSNEHSLRTLRLSTICLELNPANYSVWHFRRECLRTLQQEELIQNAMEKELLLASRLGGGNPKNYQIWYHRRAMLEQDPQSFEMYGPKELEYIAQILLHQDGKNYHAWSYRQWILKNIVIDWKESELAFVDQLLDHDVRNNSAWNHRWFSLHYGNGRSQSQKLNATDAKQELEYSIKKYAAMDPYNESPWTYATAIIKEQSSSAALVEDLLSMVEGVRDRLVQEERDPNACSALLNAQLFCYEISHRDEAALRTIDCLLECDPIRTSYWNWRKHNITSREHDKGTNNPKC